MAPPDGESVAAGCTNATRIGAGGSHSCDDAGRLRHFIVGITNSVPSFTPDGQRAVTVFVRV